MQVPVWKIHPESIEPSIVLILIDRIFTSQGHKIGKASLGS